MGLLRLCGISLEFLHNLLDELVFPDTGFELRLRSVVFTDK